MKKNILKFQQWFARIGFFPLLAAIFVGLLIRNAGLYPAIFADEWYYSSFSRLLPFKDIPVPSYLYYTVFRATNYCGDGFLECARALNYLFLIGTAPFIYLIAKRFSSRGLAAAVAIAAILGPINVYSTFFMPETMYFFAFWLFSWTVLRFYDQPAAPAALLCAATLALTSMIKIHALFLLPAFCLFLPWAVYARHDEGQGRAWIGRALALLALALLSAALLRAAVGYLYAGVAGINPLGTLYGAQAANSHAAHPSLWLLISVALGNLKGHLMGCAILFGMPVAAVVLHAADRAARARARPGSGALLLYTALMFAALLGITALFSALVAGNGGDESAARLHMRYYDFVLPLWLIIAASYAQAEPCASSRRKKLLIAVPLAAFMVYARLRLMSDFSPNFFDSPELSGMMGNKHRFSALTGLSVLALALWVRDSGRGARLFLFCVVPLMTLASASVVNQSLRPLTKSDVYIRAGQFVHQYMRQAERDRLTIVGAEWAGVFKTKFFADNTNADMLVLASGAPVDVQALKQGKNWLLVIGEHAVPGHAIVHLSKREFSLLQIVPETLGQHVFDFSVPPERDDYLEHISGLSAQESWGRWSDADSVVLTFVAPLPASFSLHIEARAFGPNSGRDFEVGVGPDRQKLRLGDAPQRQSLTFHTDGEQRALRIAIPQPTSPKELGQSGDTRKLGLALTRIELEPAAAPGAAPAKP